MIKIDVSEKLIKRVAVFEKSRSWRWLFIFISVVSVFLGVVFTFIYTVIRIFQKQQISDMFELFWQDREIIFELWQDTLITLWIELPRLEILCIVVLLVFVLWFWWTTGKKRTIIQKRLIQVKEILPKDLGDISKGGNMKKNTAIAVILLVILMFTITAVSIIFINPSQKNRGFQMTLEGSGAAGGSSQNPFGGLSEQEIIQPVEQISLEITSPAKGAHVNSPNITVRGKTSPQAEVYINDIETRAAASGIFSGSIILDEDENMIIVTAIDENGNYAEQELFVYYDMASE